MRPWTRGSRSATAWVCASSRRRKRRRLPPHSGTSQGQAADRLLARRRPLHLRQHHGQDPATYEDHRHGGQSAVPAGWQAADVHAGQQFVCLSLDDGTLMQMTDIVRPEGAPAAGAPAAGGRGGRGRAVARRSPRPGSRRAARTARSGRKKEQKELLEVIRDRAARREEDEARREEGESAQAVHAAGAADRRRDCNSRPTRSTVIADRDSKPPRARRIRSCRTTLPSRRTRRTSPDGQRGRHQSRIAAWR